MITDNDKNIVNLLRLSHLTGDNFVVAETTYDGKPAKVLCSMNKPGNGNIGFMALAILLDEAAVARLGELDGTKIEMI